MTIKIMDGFYTDIDQRQRKSIGIESGRVDQCISHALKISAYGLYGHPFHGFLEDNLDFLLEIKAIKSIAFTAHKSFKNIEAIYSLSNLEEFGLFEKRPPIQFNLLENLETVNISYNKKDVGIHALKKLKSLYFWHHKSTDGTFSNYSFPESLEKLQINWSNTHSLNGLSPLINLKELEIHRFRHLEDLSNLKYVAPNLEKLTISTSGKIKLETLDVNSLVNVNISV